MFERVPHLGYSFFERNVLPDDALVSNGQSHNEEREPEEQHQDEEDDPSCDLIDQTAACDGLEKGREKEVQRERERERVSKRER
eukprot:499713-Rhodomonas_salina.2